ncbi:MAG: hypothetical protein HFE86_05825 [Clostridiales bacterium]|nr:hypothetical protein [Clostridiales bacterium]
MEDLSAKLSSLLENPAELEQLKSLAGSLLGGALPPADPPDGPEPVSPPPAQGNGGGDTSALLSSLLQSMGGGAPAAAPVQAPAPSPMESLFSSISPKEIQAIMKIGSALKAPRQDDRSQLLLALKPHLSPARQERVDQAVKILRILDILPLLKDSGLDLFGNLL